MPRWILALALTALTACSAAQAAPSPREVRAGVDACEYCHMQVDDPVMAAQFIQAGGRVRMFDEPGCLVAWLREHAGADGAAFVADAAGGGWVPAEQALWVRGGARTGMGFDLAAFRDRGAAEGRARETGGSVADWATVLREGVRNAHGH